MLRRAAKRLKREVRGISEDLGFGLVLVAIIAIRPLMTVRLATFNPHRVGEFISRIDMAIALAHREPTDRQPTRRRNYFVLSAEIANEQVRSMYVRSLIAMPNVDLLDCRTSLLGRLLLAPARRLPARVSRDSRYASLYCGEGAATVDNCGLKPSGRPIISFTPAELEVGWRMLEPLGILPTTKYVCLHIRDSAYLSQTLPAHDWSYHDYRNPPSESYIDMVDAVLQRGYHVVRTGKVVEGPLQVQHERFFDYAVSSTRSDFLDVFLYAHATLAIAGSVSGIDQLGHAFNVPSVSTNFVPFDDPRWATDSALVIPALVGESSTGELLPLSRMMASRFGSARQYDEAGLYVVPNSPAEITRTVVEGLMRLDGSWTESPEDAALQQAFWEWAEDCGMSDAVPPGPWNSHHHRARMGRDFLDSHKETLFS